MIIIMYNISCTLCFSDISKSAVRHKFPAANQKNSSKKRIGTLRKTTSTTCVLFSSECIEKKILAAFFLIRLSFVFGIRSLQFLFLLSKVVFGSVSITAKFSQATVLQESRCRWWIIIQFSLSPPPFLWPASAWVAFSDFFQFNMQTYLDGDWEWNRTNDKADNQLLFLSYNTWYIYLSISCINVQTIVGRRK